MSRKEPTPPPAGTEKPNPPPAPPPKRGGKRPGTGNKAGSIRVAEPRTVRKGLRWTVAEWQLICLRAKAVGLSVSDYQRNKILKGD